jgi:cell shape-determining protein MreD
MTRARVIAAMAGIITVLLLQATLIAPLFVPWPVSLPAVVVGAVALVDGPATGMSFGFAAGLTADLGSHHPAGVLAMTWLGVGLLCGTVADRHSLRRDALVVGVACGLAAAVGSLLLALVRSSGGSVHDALVYCAPAGLADAALAFTVVAGVGRMLHADSLRAPHPVYTELVLGPGRG